MAPLSFGTLLFWASAFAQTQSDNEPAQVELVYKEHAYRYQAVSGGEVVLHGIGLQLLADWKTVSREPDKVVLKAQVHSLRAEVLLPGSAARNADDDFENDAERIAINWPAGELAVSITANGATLENDPRTFLKGASVANGRQPGARVTGIPARVHEAVARSVVRAAFEAFGDLLQGASNKKAKRPAGVRRLELRGEREKLEGTFEVEFDPPRPWTHGDVTMAPARARFVPPQGKGVDVPCFTSRLSWRDEDRKHIAWKVRLEHPDMDHFAGKSPPTTKLNAVVVELSAVWSPEVQPAEPKALEPKRELSEAQIFLLDLGLEEATRSHANGKASARWVDGAGRLAVWVSPSTPAGGGVASLQALFLEGRWREATAFGVAEAKLSLTARRRELRLAGLELTITASPSKVAVKVDEASWQAATRDWGREKAPAERLENSPERFEQGLATCLAGLLARLGPRAAQAHTIVKTYRAFGDVRSTPIVFCLDASSSMETWLEAAGVPLPPKAGDQDEPKIQKLEWARRELAAILDSLEPDARFQVLAFNRTVKSLGAGWTKRSQGSLVSANSFLKGVQAARGTNLHAALKKALAVEGVSTVCLLSDGAPSVGPGVDEIDRDVFHWNYLRGARIVCASFESDIANSENLCAHLARRHFGWVRILDLKTLSR